MSDKIGKKVRGKKDRYKILRPLTTKGGMGIVFVAETTSKPKTEVVIKFAHTDNPRKLEKLKLEAMILHDMQKSKPKGIVAYIDEAKDEKEEFFLVIEKLEGLDLETKIGSRKQDEKKVIKFSYEIAESLHYLHGCTDVIKYPAGIIHRDIDPKNIIVVNQNGEEHCVIIDFGAATGIKEGGSEIGKPAWSCKHNFHYPYSVTSMCDIYAFGRVMFYMATGMEPAKYEEADPRRLGNMKEEYKAERLAGVSPELSNLIHDMINFPDHAIIQTAGDVIQRLSSIRSSTIQPQRVQSRKYTVQPQQPPQGPHIILRGRRYPIIGKQCEIGQSHKCLQDFDCSRGIIHDGQDGFKYPRKPDIEIPLIGSPSESVAHAHHIRIWEDKGQWYVKDLDTTNWSAIHKNGRWIALNEGHKGKKMTLDENYTKLAIGYRSDGRTEIEFSFYKQ